jgi:hypothetical protein
MRTSDELRKEVLNQNGDGVRRLQLEVLMDIRNFLQTLVANSAPAAAQPQTSKQRQPKRNNLKLELRKLETDCEFI